MPLDLEFGKKNLGFLHKSCSCCAILLPPPAVLQENTDIYSTKEPQEAFHQRIQFCLDLYNTSIRVPVLMFPYRHTFIL